MEQVIKSKEELYDLIDSEQQDVKDKYGVDKVHSPEGLEIQNIKTYRTNIMTAKEVYEKIKDIEPFTIEGYEVKIKAKNEDEEDKKIYILNKDDLDSAVKNTVLAFVKEEEWSSLFNKSLILSINTSIIILYKF